MIPKKPAPAKAGVDTGFRIRSCSINKLERDDESKRSHPALGRASRGAGDMRDVKELIGVIMRVLDHAEITEGEVRDLAFEADGELLEALNDAYIKLLEFVHDRALRERDTALDDQERASLRDALNRIVKLSDAA